MSTRLISRGFRLAWRQKHSYQHNNIPCVVLHNRNGVYRRAFSSKTDDSGASNPSNDTTPTDNNQVKDEERPRKTTRIDRTQNHNLKSEQTTTSASSDSKSEPEPESNDSRKNKPPVIPIDKKFLPLVVTGKPPMPEYADTYTLRDAKQIRTIIRLRHEDWNLPTVVFLSRKPDIFNNAKFMTDETESFDVGCYCRTEILEDFISRTGERTLKIGLHPYYRVKKGALIANEQSEETAESENPETTANLDTASFEQEVGAKDEDSEEFPVTWMDRVVAIPDEPYDVNNSNIQWTCRKLISSLSTSIGSEIYKVENKMKEISTENGTKFNNPSVFADICAASCSESEDIQDILETFNVEKRLIKTLMLVGKESLHAGINRDINYKTVTEYAENVRRSVLRTKLQVISHELGEDNGKDKLLAQWKERINNRKIPEEVQAIIDSEIAKFMHLEHSPENNTIRSYLDWLTQLPWGIFSTDSYDIKKARQIMDEDHFGLKKVKEEILRFIAVGKLKGSVEGRILCLHGPPGIGKSSIAKSIARSLGRKMERVSLGGVYDTSEIKGHRRTYIGALPGSIIKALKRSQTQNPVILLDEIDKTGRMRSTGDVSSTLLEVLDPAQNNEFVDHYLETPIDLSKVLFICTANDVSEIPQPLLDRMELIELSAYDRYEKANIAQQYLVKVLQQDSGLDNSDLTFTREAIDEIIKFYTADAGVRKLKQNMKRIYGELARETVDGTINQDEPFVITADKVRKYLGPPIRTSDKIYEEYVPGVALGLGANSLGGMVLFVESALQQPLRPESKPLISTTGRLGKTINESSSIAYTYAKAFMTKKFPDNRFFDFADIHTHLPEGGVKKDGPSAGITMTTSLLSLALNRSMKPNLAMTGEITLAGRVLPVGAIRDKVVAARNAGCDTVLFPKDNIGDWEALPDYFKTGLRPVPVQWYDEVFKEAFGDVDVRKANDVWKKQLRVKKNHDEMTGVRRSYRENRDSQSAFVS